MRCRTSSRQLATHSWPMAHTAGRCSRASLGSPTGRDTFIALRGLLLTIGRLAEAETFLTDWAGLVSAGMLPNRRSDVGDTPDYNSVDAALWFVVAVDDFLREATETGYAVREGTRLAQAVAAILDGYMRAARATGSASTRTACCVPASRACSSPGWTRKSATGWSRRASASRSRSRRSGSTRCASPALVAAAGRRLSTPRPSGLRRALSRIRRLAACSTSSTPTIVPGKNDARIRPNQIFAVGGLPYPVLDGDCGAGRRRSVEAQAADAARPALAGAGRYLVMSPHYRGGHGERDAAYHQGTVWPWLMGPFVEAWLRVRGNPAAAKPEARARFLPPLLQHLETAGLGHVSEVADGDPPHTPGGCPFQAWSLGELIRVQRMLDGDRPLQYASEMSDARLPGPPQRHLLETAEGRRLAAIENGEKPGGAGGRISASGNGARCARTTARTAPPGTISRTIMPAAAPIAGARTASPAGATTICAGALALALWNGRDPILKERMFGLTNGEGNHGEDVKELWYYQDGTPTHSYMRMLYKYPQAEFPLPAAGRGEPRADTVTIRSSRFSIPAVFDEGRYFDVTVEYAKASARRYPDADHRGQSRPGCGDAAPAAAVLGAQHVELVGRVCACPHSRSCGRRVEAEHPAARATAPVCGRHARAACSAKTKPTCAGSTALTATGCFKDGINDFIVHGDMDAVNSARRAASARCIYQLTLAARRQRMRVRLRLRPASEAAATVC